MVSQKRDSKRLDVTVRHTLALTGTDKHSIRIIFKAFHIINRVYNALINLGNLHAAQIARVYLVRLYARYDQIIMVRITNKVRPGRIRLTIDSVQIVDGMIQTCYRFKSRAQLHALYDGFQIETLLAVDGWVTIPGIGNRFRGQELLLLSLERCAKGTTLIELSQKYGHDHSIIGRGINFFANWMQLNWVYLIRDNLVFWRPYLRNCANAIRNKLIKQYHLAINEVGSLEDPFLIAFLIDCTLVEVTRTGGGPRTQGQFAERFPLLIQEAMYQGYVGYHCVKVQTSTMPNGCNLHVSEIFSGRRHDLHLLAETNLDNRLTILTANDPPELQFMGYGDSAYPGLQRITRAINRPGSGPIDEGLNGVREAEEWTYRDVGMNWILFKKRLNWKLLATDGWRKTQNLLDLCFLFNNSLNTMQPNQISQWFELSPPTFQVYTSNGPRNFGPAIPLAI